MSPLRSRLVVSVRNTQCKDSNRPTVAVVWSKTLPQESTARSTPSSSKLALLCTRVSNLVDKFKNPRGHKEASLNEKGEGPVRTARLGRLKRQAMCLLLTTYRNEWMASTQTAIHSPRLAVHVAALVGSEKQRHPCDLIGGAPSLERVQLANLLLCAPCPGRLVHRCCHAGFDNSGAYGVDSDVRASEFCGGGSAKFRAYLKQVCNADSRYAIVFAMFITADFEAE